MLIKVFIVRRGLTDLGDYDYTGSSSSLSSGTGSASDLYCTARPDKTYYRVQVRNMQWTSYLMMIMIIVRRVLRAEGLEEKIKQRRLMMRKWETLQYLREESDQPASNVVSLSLSFQFLFDICAGSWEVTSLIELNF